MARSRSGPSSSAEANPRQPVDLLERAFREEAGRLTASLTRYFGDFYLAEELVSEAVAEALAHWPTSGVPERPGAWLLTAARRKGLDKLRRDCRYREKLELIAALPREPPREPDDRLRLIFTCCHPALSREAQIALTLRAVAGLTTDEIARAFLVPAATMAKRITRAKAKIEAARIPYRTPGPDELRERLDEVLTVIYLVFNEGYLATSGAQPLRRDLARDAEWLASLLARLMPEEPEVLALLALVRLHLARWPARLDPAGRLVLLEHQDRALWDRAEIESATKLLERAIASGKPGRYQLEAAIAAVHCESLSWEKTDWSQLVALYSMLQALDPSPVVHLSRAVALSYLAGPHVALAEVEGLEQELSRYHLFHATRAVLLRRLGHDEEAARADEQAARLTRNAAEQILIRRRSGLAG
jgi:RNA polymerase sigma factor (sigma-70 family)